MRLTTGQAAAELGVTGAPVRKLVRTGLIPGALDLARGQVFPLEALQALKAAPRADLSVLPGPELAVLRTGPATPAAGEGREWLGYDAHLTSEQILQASNRWWRCDPQRVASGRMLPVTVCEFVVAVLVGLDGWVDNGAPATMRRFHFTKAQLAGYVTDLTSTAGHVLLPGIEAEDQKLAAQLLGSRLRSQSGGPIAYVPAGLAAMREEES